MSDTPAAFEVDLSRRGARCFAIVLSYLSINKFGFCSENIYLSYTKTAVFPTLVHVCTIYGNENLIYQ
jgi:hypothetical protein